MGVMFLADANQLAIANLLAVDSARVAIED
jgi:hypothetical protein